MTGGAAGGRATSAPLMGRDAEPTIFELSAPGRRAWSLRATGVPEWPDDDLVPADLMIEAVIEDAAVKEDVFRRADGALPEESEPLAPFGVP